MPIGRERFEEGVRAPSSDNMIANFLLNNPDTAFTVEEILKGIMPNTKINSAHLLTAQDSLRRLISVNLVEARRFSDNANGGFNIYYASKSPDRFY